MAKSYKTIEQGSRGATYRESNSTFTVYEISKYPRGSVLAGQQSRRYLDSFDSLGEAKEAYPDAELIGGSTYREPFLGHLSDDSDY